MTLHMQSLHIICPLKLKGLGDIARALGFIWARLLSEQSKCVQILVCCTSKFCSWLCCVGFLLWHDIVDLQYLVINRCMGQFNMIFISSSKAGEHARAMRHLAFVAEMLQFIFRNENGYCLYLLYYYFGITKTSKCWILLDPVELNQQFFRASSEIN